MRPGSKLKDRLRRQTGESHSGVAASEDVVAQRRDQPQQPGDLFVLAQTAELPVEWAIIDRDAARPSRVLAIPADSNSLLGSTDVAVPSAAARGAMTLRCGYGVWCGVGVFEVEKRTGFLDQEIVDKALCRWRVVRDGDAAGSIDQREVDTESEYLEWVTEVLQPARAAMPESEAETDESAGGTVVAFERAPRWSSISNPWSLAASILMVLTLGLGRQVLVDGKQQRIAAAAHQHELARLDRQRQQSEAVLNDRLSRLQTAQAEAEVEHRRELEALRASQHEQPMVNLPFAVLSSGRTRSTTESFEVQSLDVPADAELVLLILRLESSRSFPRYRLEIRSGGARGSVWSRDDLTTRGAELTLALPRRLLPSGVYELYLSGLGRAQVEHLDVYRLKIDSVIETENR